MKQRIGSKKYREDMEKDVSKNPVLFGKIVCKPSNSERRGDSFPGAGSWSSGASELELE